MASESSKIDTTRRSGNKRTFSEIALDYVGRNGEKAFCCMDKNGGCTYVQNKLDIGNFIRHFRTRHPELSNSCGILKELDATIKKPRLIAKRPVAVDHQLLVEVVVKLIANRNLPISFVEWEETKLLFDRLSVAVGTGVTFNRANTIGHLEAAALKVRSVIAQEMKDKLISLKIDSASRHNRHILGINAQYSLRAVIVTRTLAMLEIRESQTANFLKQKVLETVTNYGISVQQIFSITVDNGANMLAAVRKLKEELALVSIGNAYDEDATEEINYDEDKLTADLCSEFSAKLNLIRCAAHTLQLAILDVVNKSDESVKRVTEIAKKCKNIKYRTNFSHHNATYPPVWCQTRWGGIYAMVDSFLRQRIFFDQLAVQFPELDLSNNWEFIENYAEAFKPLYICTKNMQGSHVSLSDFYMIWLITIAEVRRMTQNPFANQLVETLTDRLTNLRSSQAFQMSLYLDPRLNYMNSKIFTAEEKESIQGFIVDTWNRICQVNSFNADTSISSTSAGQTDEADDFITELFGGSFTTEPCASHSTFMKQLKALELETRQKHNFDVWRYWMSKENSHPELHAVAKVVLAVPSTQVSVERAFSGLALVLSDRRTSLNEKTLTDILMIKLNKDLFDQILPTLYKWKDTATDTIPVTTEACENVQTIH